MRHQKYRLEVLEALAQIDRGCLAFSRGMARIGIQPADTSTPCEPASMVQTDCFKQVPFVLHTSHRRANEREQSAVTVKSEHCPIAAIGIRLASDGERDSHFILVSPFSQKLVDDPLHFFLYSVSRRRVSNPSHIVSSRFAQFLNLHRL
jgi:hypothetical protein